MKINSIICIINQIKIASKHKKSSILVKKNRLNKSFLESMLRQGFISKFSLHEDREFFNVYLKSDSSLSVVFSKLKVLSSSSRNEFISYEDLCKKYSSLDFFVLLTSKGFLISNEAFFFKVGGSLICDSSNYN